MNNFFICDLKLFSFVAFHLKLKLFRSSNGLGYFNGKRLEHCKMYFFETKHNQIFAISNYQIQLKSFVLASLACTF